MSVNKEVHAYTAKRIVLSSSRPIRQVVSALREELNDAKASQIHVLLATAKDRSEMERGMAELTEGKRPLVSFGSASHSRWMNAYYEGEQSFEESWTFMIGNPLIAKEMLKHDISVGLYVPAKVLVQEVRGGGTKIVYQAAMTWLGDDIPEVLKKPLQAVDTRVQELLTRVLSGPRASL